jgi:hypothetical protein
MPLLCGFKLLILLVDSFPDVVNVITSNSMVLKQRKKLYWCKLHNSCNLQESCFSSNWFKTCQLLFSQFLELVDFSPNPVNVMCNNLRTMCGSRTSGWSLPGVMSDWQCCVDWFLAKYCRCRLRLDWCWCRWRTSVKGRCWWGLQVWRRQVWLVRGTRWPAESSAGRMVVRTARWSHGRFLGLASKPRSSREYVGAESWVVIGGGYTKFAGFPVVHQKTTRFLGWSTKPRLKNRRRRCSSSRLV